MGFGEKRKKDAQERTSVVFFFFDSSEILVEGFGPEEVLNLAGRSGIPVKDVRIADETSVSMIVRTADLQEFKEILGNKYRIKRIRSYGILPFCRKLLKRKGLLIGAVCFAAIVYAQQLFIAEMRIEGNTGISEEEISEVLKENGLFIGCRKSQVDEETIKNRLYASFSDITWVGVDVKGALAVVEIAEGDKYEKKTEESDTPCDIAASKSGYIKEVITRYGTQIVQPGDYVQAGDVLISSEVKANNTTYDESRNDMVKYVRASGDVTAVVVYKLEAQFDKGKFTEKEMEHAVESAVRKYVREKAPEKIEIIKKDLKFIEEENIIRCGVTLEISENIGYERETEFAGT